MSLPDSYDRWRTNCEPEHEQIEASYDEVAEIVPEEASDWDAQWVADHACEIAEALTDEDMAALSALRSSLASYRSEQAAEWCCENQDKLRESLEM